MTPISKTFRAVILIAVVRISKQVFTNAPPSPSDSSTSNLVTVKGNHFQIPKPSAGPFELICPKRNTEEDVHWYVRTSDTKYESLVNITKGFADITRNTLDSLTRNTGARIDIRQDGALFVRDPACNVIAQFTCSSESYRDNYFDVVNCEVHTNRTQVSGIAVLAASSDAQGHLAVSHGRASHGPERRRTIELKVLGTDGYRLSELFGDWFFVNDNAMTHLYSYLKNNTLENCDAITTLEKAKNITYGLTKEGALTIGDDTCGHSAAYALRREELQEWHYFSVVNCTVFPTAILADESSTLFCPNTNPEHFLFFTWYFTSWEGIKHGLFRVYVDKTLVWLYESTLTYSLTETKALVISGNPSEQRGTYRCERGAKVGHRNEDYCYSLDSDMSYLMYPCKVKSYVSSAGTKPRTSMLHDFPEFWLKSIPKLLWVVGIFMCMFVQGLVAVINL